MARIKLSGQRGPKRSGQRGCKKTEVGRGYVVLVGLLLLFVAARCCCPPTCGWLPVMLCHRLILSSGMCDRRRDVIVSRAVSDKRSAVQAAQRRARDRAIRRGKQRTKPGGAYATAHPAKFGRFKPELAYQRAGAISWCQSRCTFSSRKAMLNDGAGL